MQLQIERIPAALLPVETFLEEYYLPERPVVITGLETPDEKLVFELLKQQNTMSGFGFIGAPLPTATAALEIPRVVEAVLARHDIVTRACPMRIWVQSKGHHTHHHFDGNSLHGFNWHIKGTKQWTLLSPDTPPPLYPFSYLSMTRDDFQPDPRKHDFYRFQMTAGELLFLPRYWSHAVSSLDDINMNLNWVWTPRAPNLRVAVGRRECAMLAWRDRIPGLWRLLIYAGSVRNYAEGGEQLFNTYAGSLSRWQMLRYLLAEVPGLLLLPFNYRRVRRQAAKLDTGTASTLEKLR